MKRRPAYLHSPRTVLIAAALVLLGTVVFVGISLLNHPMQPPARRAASPAPDVSVIDVVPGSYRASVSAYGAAQPHYTLTLTAKVSGYVASLSPRFESGGVIAKGETLLQLEDSDYRSALASAKQTLATAKLSLLEEQRQAMQARAEWDSTGLEGEPDSPLVLRQPYVDAAKATVDSATASVTSASANLDHTTIAAPFDAIVVERTVAPGHYVQAGTGIATLYSTDRVEVSLTLSASDWRKLPAANDLVNNPWPVNLRNVDGSGHWTGYVARVERHLNSSTRQRALVVAVDTPLDQAAPLLAGTFVDVDIPGRTLPGLWRLPSSALSQRSEIWYVSTGNTLASFAITPQFSDGNYIYVQPPAALARVSQQVLLHPLSNYLPGMQVTPVAATDTTVTADSRTKGTIGESNPRESDNG